MDRFMRAKLLLERFNKKKESSELKGILKDPSKSKLYKFSV